MDTFGYFMVLVIGIVMLSGLFSMINQERSKEGRGPIGCVPSILIIIVVIAIWIIMSML